MTRRLITDSDLKQNKHVKNAESKLSTDNKADINEICEDLKKTLFFYSKSFLAAAQTKQVDVNDLKNIKVFTECLKSVNDIEQSNNKVKNLSLMSAKELKELVDSIMDETEQEQSDDEESTSNSDEDKIVRNLF